MSDSSQVPDTGGEPQPAQAKALGDLGLDQHQQQAFIRGEMVVYGFVTGQEAAIAQVVLRGNRLRRGLISIRDVGGGVRDFLRFRERSLAVAKAFGASELELFGAAVFNQRLEAILLRHGFTSNTDTVPEDLGGGTMEILSKVFLLR